MSTSPSLPSPHDPTPPTIDHAVSTLVALLAELAAEDWLTEQTEESRP